MSKELIPVARIAQSILYLRGQKTILDSELSALYGVATKVLNQAVKRNAVRFPEDFMFQLTAEESRSLRSQFVTLKHGKHLMAPPQKPAREIGFHVREKAPPYRARNRR
jgi:ORF6N domain